MHELPALLLAQHGAPRRHRAVRESNADHVVELSVGVLRNVEHEIGRLGFESHAGGAVAPAAIAVAGDTALAEDRAPSRNRFARRHSRVVELRRRAEPARPVTLLGEGPPRSDDRAGRDERGERPPQKTAARRFAYAVRLRASERRRSTYAPTIVIRMTPPPMRNAGSIFGGSTPAVAGAIVGAGVTGTAAMTCTRTPLRLSGD